MTSSPTHTYTTTGGLTVAATRTQLPYGDACDELIGRLDARRGVLFSSGMEAPGRYTRWDMGFTDPPLVLTAVDRRFTIEALNARGAVLLPAIAEALRGHADVEDLEIGLPSSLMGGAISDRRHAEERPEAASRSTHDRHACFETPASQAPQHDAEGSLRQGSQEEDGGRITGSVRVPSERFAEEHRSRQPSIFSVVRALRELFGSRDDEHLGLYGAFAYDLAFQFEPVERRIPRPADARDLVLYLPDELVLVDHARRVAERRTYEFGALGRSTAGLPRATPEAPYVTAGTVEAGGDHGPGEYAATVRLAQESFARGDLFEVVPGQTFRTPCPDQPSVLFRRLTAANPAPYGALINLGEGEFLVGASPEMYVRVRGSRVETCPISGTIARGRDAFEDADQIRTLLASSKDEAELTMCTDVDRNDKARVCEPGSVKVLARRQIETYSRLFHTVDHVEGLLRPDMDALDAFLTHAWAVTVTGAPKRWAMDFIERHERSARRWYAGAVGRLTFDGNLDTGITIRTARLKDGTAEVRAGATLLHDSDPEAENAECALKASALLGCLAGTAGRAAAMGPPLHSLAGDRRILLVDFEDSFVHNLADYFRQTGARVDTFRHGDAVGEIGRAASDLVVLSPGPGRPADFAMSDIIDAALSRGLPVFGVCLGLQGLVEHFGGTLDQLAVPVHGKPSEITLRPGARMFDGLPERLVVGRYHSLHANRIALPAEIRVAATTADEVIMAVEHRTLPIAAVQFHPESILSARGDAGLALLAQVVGRLLAEREAALSKGPAAGAPGSAAGRSEPGRPPAEAAAAA